MDEGVLLTDKYAVPTPVDALESIIVYVVAEVVLGESKKATGICITNAPPELYPYPIPKVPLPNCVLPRFNCAAATALVVGL